jgi:hypothetical protein
VGLISVTAINHRGGGVVSEHTHFFRLVVDFFNWSTTQNKNSETVLDGLLM